MRWTSRLAVETADWLRWNPAVRAALCGGQFLRASLPRPHDANHAAGLVARACAAARLAPCAAWLPVIERKIHRLVRDIDPARLDWPRLVPGAEKRRMEKAVVLKAPVGPREKGVLLVSFEYQWARLAHGCDLRQLAEAYTLVVAPTWSPPHDLVNCIFPRVFPQPIFCLISGPNDVEIFPRLSERYRVVPLYASNWVNPALFRPVPFSEKTIDILTLANFGKYKRHFLLFKALRDLPASTRVVLIGQPNGRRTEAVLRAEARSYGVEDRFELRVSATNEEVTHALLHAKTSLILSRREGSCVAVVESMFANTPVGLLADAEIGSKVFINGSTGRLLNYRNLGGQLGEFVAAAQNYSPRAWVEPRLSCFQSTQTLNEALKSSALAAGQEWTQDIAVHHWHPDPQLVFPEDRQRLAASHADLRARFGIEAG